MNLAMEGRGRDSPVPSGDACGGDADDHPLRIAHLFRERPRSHFVRYSLLLLAALVVSSWMAGNFHLMEFFSARRLDNLRRFLGELRPYPLQGKDFDIVVAVEWAGEILATKGATAAWVTLAISVAAIVLAAMGSLVLCLPAARSVASAEPFLPASNVPGRVLRVSWWAVIYGTRCLFIFLRAIPELVWAYLLIAIVGPSAWPAVLALGFHNLGILGKLNAEAVENLEPGNLSALRGLGATRAQIAAAGIFPAVLNRFLLFFFYRWESCVREATVLGLLGIVSLGYWIQDARARNQYDTMFFLVLLGAALVLAGDLVSTLARRWVRRAG
jgi:phosphonate transport system permease protein